jgi:hypothetical protein
VSSFVAADLGCASSSAADDVALLQLDRGMERSRRARDRPSCGQGAARWRSAVGGKLATVRENCGDVIVSYKHGTARHSRLLPAL